MRNWRRRKVEAKESEALMGLLTIRLCGFLSVGALAYAADALLPDPPQVCTQCEAMNRPHEPFRVFGNTYYVGVAGVSSVLITSERGLILLDGDLTQSAALIDANIRKLGFRRVGSDASWCEARKSEVPTIRYVRRRPLLGRLWRSSKR